MINYLNLINQKLFSIINNKLAKQQDKPLLFVLKGFDNNILKEIEESQVFKLSSETSINNIFENKLKLTTEFFMNVPKYTIDKYFLCNFEEFIIFNESCSLVFKPIIITNNLYKNLFPLNYKIENVDKILDSFELNSNSQEFVNTPEYINFNSLYSNLVSIDEDYYITYNFDANNISNVSLFSNIESILPIEIKSIYDNNVYELTDDETSYLKLLNNILDFNNSTIYVSLSGSLGEYSIYQEQIDILSNIFKSDKDIILCAQRNIKTNVDKISDYLDILKRYWGYTSFKDLKMYKNIYDDTNYRDTVDISQAQIINDIITQAELALDCKENEVNFRDIFVTSPTGAGKSIMFQIPAIYLAEKHQAMTIIISPLIGLMVDQVEGLHNNNIHFSATINSDITPVEKMDIKQKIHDGEISILYISPETLLSRSDITELIGERKVGLFVIDEAHIVTTWGKSFRADYWYLGNYLDKLRSGSKYKKAYKFPISTFTATAILGGIEDMYKETKDSLNLINPLPHFGYVKREDIETKFKYVVLKKEKGKSKEYLDSKLNITLKRLELFCKINQKTLVYFPTVKLIYELANYIELHGSTKLKANICIYHGKLDSQNKNSNYLKFKNNDGLIMLATKAFGMGIDIPDILNVYHFAPTGNVCDYIQEIGRAARSLDTGYAYIDYFSQDASHVNRLHGLSSIRKNQLIQIIEKILNLYKANKYNRRMLVSCEEFKHIFPNSLDDDDSGLNNKVKSCLMILQKDFILKLGYSPIMVKPRSLFTNEFFIVPYANEEYLLKRYSNYLKLTDTNSNFSKIGNVYTLDMKSLWEKTNNNISFPSFKYKFYTEKSELKLSSLDSLTPVVMIDLAIKTQTVNEFHYTYDNIVDCLKEIFGKYSLSKKFMSIDDLTIELQTLIKKDKYFCESIITTVINSMVYHQKNSRYNTNFASKKYLTFYESRNAYKINNTYDEFFIWFKNKVNNIFTNSINQSQQEFKTYTMKNPTNKSSLDDLFVTLGLLETFGLIVYEINGGGTPEIYIHLNSEYQLKQIISNADTYNNKILSNVFLRHKISVKLLENIFTNNIDTDEFWNTIEEYFLGRYDVSTLLN